MRKIFEAGTRRADQPAQVRSRLRTGMIAASVVVSSLVYSTMASALGLGEISLHSALNQPLNAEIELLETDGLSPEDIVTRLASPDAFARAGIERVFFLNDLRFTPVLRAGRSVIKVVSSKPVTEPYLSFLVQVARPNGDLLHEYTVLLDPATSPEGLAATRSRNPQRTAQAAAPQTRMPVAPPPAVQGKRYTVANGDTLNGIAGRLQGPGSKVSASQLADGIRSLNPQVFASGANSGLRIGQDLLVPDSAVLPGTSSAAPAAPAAATPKAEVQPADARQTADQLTVAAIQNQQLVKSLEDLKTQTSELQETLAGKDKQIMALRADLALAQSSAAPVATSATQVSAASPAISPQSPAAPPVVAASAADESFINIPTLLGVLLVLLLLAALLYARRRQKHKSEGAMTDTPDEGLIKPAQSSILPVFEVPAVAPQPVVAPVASKPVTSQRLAGAAPDALDGVSIYIAYGRFSEAIGILRAALEKQPEREDIRVRLLELLAEQGDSAGFAREEQAALEQGVDPQTLQTLHDRYPLLKVSAAAALAVAPAAMASMSLDKSQPDSRPVVSPVAEPEPAAQLDETAAAALNPEPADEFQLNLDDLSMDANWDLVDPFDSPPARVKPAPEVQVDPEFSSDLTQLPEVMELSDEQFLSDFSETEEIEPIEVIAQPATDDLSDDFLDSFMTDDSDFDLLDLEEPPLTQINQAQVLIEEGDIESAREILLQILEESDDEHRRMAQELLAGIS